MTSWWDLFSCHGLLLNETASDVRGQETELSGQRLRSQTKVYAALGGVGVLGIHKEARSAEARRTPPMREQEQRKSQSRLALSRCLAIAWQWILRRITFK